MDDRRQPGARIPFEALVEIAAPEGASFEAESVDLSTSGMHLRTAYLPKVGTPLMFRFETAADGAPVVANGEVVWAQDGEGGSEFGVRFADLKPEGAEAIRNIIGVMPPKAMTPAGQTTTWTAISKPGSPVRIHIEGMPAPMRATMRDEVKKGAIVGSELKMLKIGAVVELEDKERRTRRAARVDAVECEIDEATRIPQLVVKLRYDVETSEGPFLTTQRAPMPADVEHAAREIRASHPQMTPMPVPPTTMPPPGAQARMALPVASNAEAAEPSEPPAKVASPVPPPSSMSSDSGEVASSEPEEPIALRNEKADSKKDGMRDGMKVMGEKMKGAFTTASAIASRFGSRIGTTVSLLTKRNQGAESADETEARRTTSPVGTIHRSRMLRPQAASRDFMTGEGIEEAAMQEIDMKKVARRRQIGIAAGVGVALMLGFLAFRKPAQHAPVVQAPAPELAPAAQQPIAPPPVAPAAPPPPAADTAAASAAPLVGDSTGVDAKGNPNPFGTPSVKKGTKMLLRLDGPVAEIKGMQMPNGFVVSVPNRKSLEAAGPLAAKDPRISSAKVVNQPNGAELTIAFKDAAPTYVVKAKGDALEIVLSHDKAIAKKGKGKSPSAPKAPHPKKK